MKLSELKTGDKAVIIKVRGRGAFRKRIIEMGFIKGKTVEVLLNAPLKDPIEYKVMDYEISLRKSEAALVEVVAESEALNSNEYEILPQTSPSDRLREIADQRSRTINVALVGNPNSGKTSLFNIASGAHEHVGNYSGVTVDAKEGKFKHKGYTFNIVDLPGTYSLSAYTPEEIFVRKQITEEHPDIIINVVAASNLERNLYLTTQLIDIDATTVIALNMYDELEKSGAKFDFVAMGNLIGYPIVPTVSKTGRGVDKLFEKVIEVYEGKEATARHVHIYYGEDLERSIAAIIKTINDKDCIGKEKTIRAISIKLLEGDKESEKFVQSLSNATNIFAERDLQIKAIHTYLKEDPETAFTDARYGFIDGALKQTYKEGHVDALKTTHIIDAIVTHKIWGYPIFFLFMFLMFQGTFKLGEYPQQAIEWLVGLLSDFVNTLMPAGPLKNLLVNGIIGGVGSVIIFLPNIVLLYLFISIMEDTGYMARAAFIMDKFMHKMGLHGKSFIPLVMGFGCNVPAIMATRTIESRNSRLITMLINPLMSCSARLPVYMLFTGAFFGKHAGLALFGLYITGILLAVIMSRLFKRFLIRDEDLPFVMELPPYRMPTSKAIFRHMWDKSSQYVRKMGGIILVASIIIWFLGYFPQNEERNKAYELQIENIEANNNTSYTDTEKEQLVSEIEHKKNTEHQINSYIGQLGHITEPLVRPLGFDWKISVSLITGMAAKEIVVSTLAVLYTGNENDSSSLEKRLQTETRVDGSPTFTTPVLISLLLFVLIYFPCIATIAAIKNESGSWKWAAFVVFYTTSLAWIISFAVYQIGTFILN
ncbi:ferrous iron transporter protein B and GTP-binding protein [Bacteroidales bacterium]|nr:ferrous iron transporter protein B and GTP-binding protein [Bacteroidales bacterium]